MSRAFVKEDDGSGADSLHELPVSDAPNLVTERGLAAIEAKVKELEEQLHVAPNEEQAARLRRDLRYWHGRRATAQLTEAHGDGVGFGTRVRYRRGREEHVIEIVGEDEADPKAGLIAYTAPIARAMMGAERGDVVEMSPVNLKILSVEPIG